MAYETPGTGGAMRGAPVAALADTRLPKGRLREWWSEMLIGPLAFYRITSAAVGFWIVVAWVLLAILAPVLAPYKPNAADGPLRSAPSAQYLFGTDAIGRDVLSRILWGARPILLLSPLAVACATVVGVTIGLTAGYLGGVADDLLMRLLDAAMSFPDVLLYMIIIAAVGPSKLNVVLAITIGGFPGVARLTRSMVLDVKNREYVEAARLRGEPALYIMFREILPNCMGPVFIDACLRVGYAAFALGTLGFLGLGLPPPDPDWGKMVAEGRMWITIAPWMTVAPSLAISSLVVGLNLFADGINAARRKF